jgi:hypothetical protein
VLEFELEALAGVQLLAASAAVSGQPPPTQLATVARCSLLNPPPGGIAPEETSLPICVQRARAEAKLAKLGSPPPPAWQREHTGACTSGKKSVS